MRPILLALFGGLVFLLVATLLQSIFGLGNPQMRVLLATIVGSGPEGGYGWRWALLDLLVYPCAAAITGAIVYPLGRLMYRRA